MMEPRSSSGEAAAVDAGTARGLFWRRRALVWLALFVGAAVAGALLIPVAFLSEVMVGLWAGVLVLLLVAGFVVVLAGLTVRTALRAHSTSFAVVGLLLIVGGVAGGVGLSLQWLRGLQLDGPPPVEQRAGRLTVTLQEFPGLSLAGSAGCVIAQDGYVESVSGSLGQLSGGEIGVNHVAVERDGAGSLVISWSSPGAPEGYYVPDGATITVVSVTSDGRSGTLRFTGLSIPDDPAYGPIGGPDGPRTVSGSVEWECEI